MEPANTQVLTPRVVLGFFLFFTSSSPISSVNFASRIHFNWVHFSPLVLSLPIGFPATSSSQVFYLLLVPLESVLQSTQRDQTKSQQYLLKHFPVASHCHLYSLKSLILPARPFKIWLCSVTSCMKTNQCKNQSQRDL